MSTTQPPAAFVRESANLEAEYGADYANSRSIFITNDASLQDLSFTIVADDAMKLKQMQELVKGYFVRRKLDPGCLEWKPEEKASGNTLRQVVVVKQGVDKELAKSLVKAIKDSKLKVQVLIQGDELRVTGKKRDDLQETIQHVKSLGIELPLQYVNFRE